MRLTTSTIRAIDRDHGDATDYIEWDDDVPGFGYRIRGNSRSFVFQYKIGTKTRRMTLGVASAISAEKARNGYRDEDGKSRKGAEALYHDVKTGGDPAGNKVEARRQANETFKSVLDRYLDYKRKELRPRSMLEVERHLATRAKPLHQLSLTKIERRDIAALRATMPDVTANRVRDSLSGFFRWTMEEGLRDDNPVAGTRKHEEKSRERVLLPRELRAIWNALNDDQYGSIVKLLALTGQRLNEIAGLRWSEIEDNKIRLPAERVKNAREHVVPLSTAALEIIKQQDRRDGRDLVFGRGDGGFSGWSRCKERLDAKIGDAISEPWRVHDLRRSFATYAGGGLPEKLEKHLAAWEREPAKGLGIQPHVVEAILNHVGLFKAGVAQVYNLSTYETEKRIALDRWADHLGAIVEGGKSKITPLRKRG
jgi:integrase